MMKNPLITLRSLSAGMPGRRGKFVFTTLARLIAMGCMAIAAYFAWRLSGQLNL